MPTIDLLDSANQKYDNTTSGLTAEDAQAAIDELKIADSAFVLKTTTYTAVRGDLLFADTTGGAFTITLPVTPVLGYKVTVHDVAGNFATANLTIGRAGETIMDTASDLVLSTNNETVELVYSGSDWRKL